MEDRIIFKLFTVWDSGWCLCTMPRSPPNSLEHVSKMCWCIFRTFTGTFPGKSMTEHIVKGNVYFDDLGMGSIYVITNRI